MATFLSFLDIASLTYTVFPSPRDLGPAVTFNCKHCQACQEEWADDTQVIPSSRKEHISNSHSVMIQLLTKLPVVKPNTTFVIHYVTLYFKNTIITLHVISVMIQERDKPFAVFQILLSFTDGAKIV